MGKPKGDGARSKTRSSSSSLAASLLPSGSASIGFGGYVGSSRLEPAPSTVDAVPFLDVDGELAQYLKRIGRKDPITKLKALTALSTLFKQRPVEEILQIVPQWAFEYKKLLFDFNREVRRATHDTMTSLVTNVGRGIAPRLKSLMGPWWFSQFDPVSEVSQAAKRSLQAAFPSPEKRLDALLLYASDIFMYLNENLQLTPQTMTDKGIAIDELEEMHQRVIFSSLLALASMMDILLEKQSKKSNIGNLISEPKTAFSKARTSAASYAETMFCSHNYFLEFLKSKNPEIRLATYSVLQSFIKHAPHVFDDGNMKILASLILGSFQEKIPSCHSSMWDTILLFSKTFPESWSIGNLQKTVVAQFWQFLSNGCYGSQQISYPILVLFISSLPPKMVMENHFLLGFFKNLWTGRNPTDSSIEHQLSFFKAFKECFIWVIHNVPRSSEIEHACSVESMLVKNVLSSILWHDYLSLISSDGQDGSLHGKNIEYPISYLQNLGKCIVEILSDISNINSKLLEDFSLSFHNDCLKIFSQTKCLPNFSLQVKRVSDFLFLLDQYAMPKGDEWPFVKLVGPLTRKSFQLIKNSQSPDVIRVLHTIISIFGARATMLSLFPFTNEQFDQQFLQHFKDDIIPWCLFAYNNCTDARLDVLLTLFYDELFFEQWNHILIFATKSVTREKEALCMDQMYILALLMEKVRLKTCHMKLKDESSSKIGSCSEHWHHELLNSTAISIAQSTSSFQRCHVRFICALLGGSATGDHVCFVNHVTLTIIFEEIRRTIASLLMASHFTWSKYASSLLLPSERWKSLSSEILETAEFAFEVLKNCLFCVEILNADSDLIPSILASVFIIDWKNSLESLVCEDGKQRNWGDDIAVCYSTSESLDCDLENRDSKRTLGLSIHNVFSATNTDFWRGLGSHSFKMLESILINTIKSAVFDTETCIDKISTACCEWFLQVNNLICWNQDMEQALLDHVLYPGESWPLWATPISNEGIRSVSFTSEEIQSDKHDARHQHFAAFVNKLILKLGINRVIAGSNNVTEDEQSEKCNVVCTSYPRSWLAVEMLCTWKCEGGSSVENLLPLLSECSKTRYLCPCGSIVHSVVNNLFDGALLHGDSMKIVFFDVWVALDDEIENISDPFLRALVSLLSILFIKNKVWGREEAFWLFDYIKNKLFVGQNVNRSCLKILPFVMNVLIHPLRDNKIDHDGHIRDSILIWLQLALSSQKEHQEEWVQAVTSCYPLSPSGGLEAFKVALSIDIDHLEKSKLLDLYRCQRIAHDISETDNLLSLSESGTSDVLLSHSILHTNLAKLMAIAIGYCWKECNEEDYEFMLFQVHKWIESVVISSEEITERIDGLVTNATSDNSEITLKRIEEALQVLHPFSMNIAKMAIFIFTLFYALEELESEEMFGSNFLRNENMSQIKDRILEGIFRLFFATGVIEAITNSYSDQASCIIAYNRHLHSHFWEIVSFCVRKSPQHVKNGAFASVELWGLSKGPISSLYAMLFSLEPISSLQLAAFIILSANPISHSVIYKKGDSFSNEKCASSEESIHLRDEISWMIQKGACDIIGDELLSRNRVNILISWALLLTYLQSLPSSSPEREKLVQCIQDTANWEILNMIFQFIPIKLGSSQNLKKKAVEFPEEIRRAGAASEASIRTCSVLFAIESLWPIDLGKMASLAGALYGLILLLLPAYVRSWFAGLRDRSMSSSIDYFTKTWCSPTLLAYELSQIKETVVPDDNFSVIVNKSTYEVIATYTKEETGMDLIICLPSSYPLRPVEVDCTRSLGISEIKQRKWLLYMTTYIRNQNGAIAEAVRVWKSNFDKEFQGVEECPICYNIIHSSNHSFPLLSCKTCKHKFHSACLYKWFSTSHKSTCPLCQTAF